MCPLREHEAVTTSAFAQILSTSLGVHDPGADAGACGLLRLSSVPSVQKGTCLSPPHPRLCLGMAVSTEILYL